LTKIIVRESALHSMCYLREISRTEYQLRFSCGTNSRGNCTAVLNEPTTSVTKSLNVITPTFEVERTVD